ncbi:DUF4189 domain-containing protein [Mycobacterium marinum]|uniref:Conserved hypothetical secreted protein n=1 Tax=Mycobacterium marinum (strain ATCC BAA-535 / M) TaxID=216594 RepID=B2HRC9_MYCMM|nr:DUF4189 domain-containing protein [Mycobacterium marinum]ACC42560.1 conserved hypothetical secreted protein [Mycobacterium marinum M]MDC8984407.1 DUF4189 domain-containing protein [Mycobacterium marinum]MDC8993006.1 DUF4189 domain-containing protein [Mycobacterium marinum]MDC9001402.1 DUF4189 domain-containing protein [Mycobacterium marinum]MDC9012094.1 DUF4189 domain-containing protein [Mycobacterium marinum]
MTTNSRRRRLAVAVASVATATATTLTLAPVADAADQYGAIAYSGDGSWGRASHYPTRAAAEATAVKLCGYSDCKVLTTFTACGAVAADGKTFEGGVGPTLSAAMKDALSKLGGGYIDTWACN